MKRIEIRLNLPQVAPLLDLMRSTVTALDGDTAAQNRIQDMDTDMREIWREELLNSQRDELRGLMNLFDDEFFSSGLISISEDKADAIVRATAAIRLQLRRAHLQGLDDSMLESGQVSIDALTQGEQSSFMTYVFLASLQELVIDQLENGGKKTSGPVDDTPDFE